MEKWRLDRFNSLLGQTLKAKEINGNGECDVQVTEVIESTSAPEGWEAFSVIMKCEASSIEQGSLEFSHEEFGTTTVFVTPKSETELESVFSYDLSA